MSLHRTIALFLSAMLAACGAAPPPETCDAVRARAARRPLVLPLSPCPVVVKAGS